MHTRCCLRRKYMQSLADNINKSYALRRINSSSDKIKTVMIHKTWWRLYNIKYTLSQQHLLTSQYTERWSRVRSAIEHKKITVIYNTHYWLGLGTYQQVSCLAGHASQTTVVPSATGTKHLNRRQAPCLLPTLLNAISASLPYQIPFWQLTNSVVHESLISSV